MEIFPIKKTGIQVSTADGEKMNLEALRPGNDVIIYYEQQGDRRTVKQIVVLATEPEESNQQHPPRSYVSSSHTRSRGRAATGRHLQPT